MRYAVSVLVTVYLNCDVGLEMLPQQFRGVVALVAELTLVNRDLYLHVRSSAKRKNDT